MKRRPFRDIANAPRDGTPVRLHLPDGTDFVGYYTDRWWGWVALLDPWPLIRGDIRFAGWEPVGDEEVRRLRQPVAGPCPIHCRGGDRARDPATGDREGTQAEAALMSESDGFHDVTLECLCDECDDETGSHDCRC
jgi:hypothetical protein